MHQNLKYKVNLKLVHIITKVVSSFTVHSDVCSMQYNGIKVGAFRWVLRFPPSIKLITTM